MIKNYLTIALRNLSKNRGTSFINITGLAVGMTVAMLIGLWIFDELSFNRYHKNYESIVKVMDHQEGHGRQNTNDVLPIPLGTVLHSMYASDFKNLVMVRETEEHIIGAGDKKFTQAGNYMQADAPEMLSLEMVAGTRKGLQHLHSILLSESLSKKLFGVGDPLDKILRLDAQTDVKVTGVFKDLPNNSEFRTTSFILPFELFGAPKDDWHNYNIMIYARLNDHSDIDEVSAKIKNVLSERAGEQHVYSSAVSSSNEQMAFILRI